jgi:hypothetical protein
MKRIFCSITFLMIAASLSSIINDWLDEDHIDIVGGLFDGFIVPVITFFVAPLGIGLLFEIYGAHYLALGLISFFMIVYGFVKSKKVYGQIVAVSGAIIWSLLGAYGLGHGG